jgi:hypothetical protein
MNSATCQNQNLSVLGVLTVANRNTDARELTLDELALVAGGETTGSNK